MKTKVDPKEGSIFKNIIIFSLPIVLVTLLQTLLTTCDSVVIGKFGEEDSLSAIGINSNFFYFIIGGTSGLANGIFSILGKYFGKNDEENIKKIHNSIPLTGFIIGLIIAIIFIPIGKPILVNILNCPSIILDKAYTYYTIYFLATPFTVLYSFETAVVESSGDSYHPLLIGLISSIINTVLNLLFVLVFKMDIFGVALATLISIIFSAISILLFEFKSDSLIHFNIKELTIFKNMKDIFKIGIPSSLEYMAMTLSGVVLTRAISTFNINNLKENDTSIIKGNTASSSIEGLMSLAFVGFASASSVFVAQNYGAKNFDRIKRSVLYIFIMTFILGELIGSLVYIFGDNLLTLFINNDSLYKEEVIYYGLIRLKYMGLLFGFCGIMNIMTGAIIGLESSKMQLLISIICSCVIRIGFILLYAIKQDRIDYIYLAFPICWILSSILESLWFIFLYNKRKKNEMI